MRLSHIQIKHFATICHCNAQSPPPATGLFLGSSQPCKIVFCLHARTCSELSCARSWRKLLTPCLRKHLSKPERDTSAQMNSRTTRSKSSKDSNKLVYKYTVTSSWADVNMVCRRCAACDRSSKSWCDFSICAPRLQRYRSVWQAQQSSHRQIPALLEQQHSTGVFAQLHLHVMPSRTVA